MDYYLTTIYCYLFLISVIIYNYLLLLSSLLSLTILLNLFLYVVGVRTEAKKCVVEENVAIGFSDQCYSAG